MGRGRTVTYKGAAAQAFVEAMEGKRAETDDERAERIATMIYGEIQSGDMARAKLIVCALAADGLEKTADALTRKHG